MWHTTLTSLLKMVYLTTSSRCKLPTLTKKILSRRYSSTQSMSISYRHNLELSKYSIPYKTYNYSFVHLLIPSRFPIFLNGYNPLLSLFYLLGLSSPFSEYWSWHEVFQIHLILSLPQPWNQPFLQGAPVSLRTALPKQTISSQYSYFDIPSQSPLHRAHRTPCPVPGQLPSPGRDASPAWRHLIAFRDEVFEKGDSKGWCDSALLLKELIFQEMLQIWSFIWNLLLNADNSFKISKNNR